MEMGKGWGYGRRGFTGAGVRLQRNKKLVNVTDLGTHVYRSEVGEGATKVTVIWHDNRKSDLPSKLIIKGFLSTKCFDVSHLKTQKEIFGYAEKMIDEYGL